MIDKEALLKFKELAEKYPHIADHLGLCVSFIDSNLKVQELSTQFNIPIPYSYSHAYIQLDDLCYIARYGTEDKRSISWPDDGRQPEEGEYLFSIKYPTGAYSMHQDYPEDTFCQYFEELKKFNPKYSDTENKALYFTAENAKAVYDNYKSIFQKYKGRVDEELKERKRQALLNELKNLDKVDAKIIEDKA